MINIDFLTSFYGVQSFSFNEEDLFIFNSWCSHINSILRLGAFKFLESEVTKKTVEETTEKSAEKPIEIVNIEIIENSVSTKKSGSRSTRFCNIIHVEKS